MASPNRSRFADVALAMLRAEQLQGGQHTDALTRAFTSSDILKPEQLAELGRPLPTGSPLEVAELLGAKEYALVRSVSDRQGYTTHEFLLSEETAVAAPGWSLNEPLLIDVTAGLSLTYNSAGQLVHVAHQKKDPESEVHGLPDAATLFDGEGSDEVSRSWSENGLKLEQLPIFRD